MSGSALRKFILFDANGRELELTTENNVPVAIKDANGLDLELTALSNIPVELLDSNGLNLDLDLNSNVPVVLNNPDGAPVEVQHPLPTDGDSVYVKDIWVAQSDLGDFSGAITDLFDNLHSIITDITATNPKEIMIHFNRSVSSNSIDLGAFTGDFSNVEISTSGSDHIFAIQVDESADSTKYQSRLYRFETTIEFNIIKIKFYTADTVTLSNCVVLKSRNVIARVHGPNGLEYAQDEATGDRIIIDHAHHEIHEGRTFTVFSDQDPVASSIIAFRVEDQARIPHMTVSWKTEESGTLTLYRGATWTTGTGTLFTPINSNQNSLNESILQGDSTGAFLSNEVVIDPAGLATGAATLDYQESVWSTNQSPAGGGSGIRNEYNLIPGETYAAQIVCGLGGTWLFFDWYEHAPIG